VQPPRADAVVIDKVAAPLGQFADLDHGTPLCEGRSQVCRSGRFTITALNLSNKTYNRATLVCSLFRKEGHRVIATTGQEIQGPIFPRQVNKAITAVEDDEKKAEDY
jgi:hypothetical protein